MPPEDKSSPDDVQAWLEEIENVKPLEKARSLKKRLLDAVPEALDPPPKTAPSALDVSRGTKTPMKPSTLEDMRLTDTARTDVWSAVRSGIDERTRKKLSRGQIPVEAMLDLHGLLVQQAWEQLMAFLERSQRAERRCVLVIHGKGKGFGEGGRMGAIKAQMPQWLNSHSAVLAYHTATARDGGSGALYVLLRRRRREGAENVDAD